MKNIIRNILLVSSLYALAGHSAAADARNSFPARPVTLVVPFAPGGNTDVVARIYAKKLAETLGQSVVVENKAGAGAVIGMTHVAQSKPDGYTLLFGTAAYPISGMLHKKLPYDSERALTPVGLVAEVPMLLSANARYVDMGAKAFIGEIRKNPGKFTFASGGSGSSPHMAVELLKLQENLDIVHIPFRGANPALLAVMSGEVDFMMDPVSTSVPMIASGKIKALAVSSSRRSSLLPDIPTLKELGFINYETSAWNMVYAPAGTPADILSRISEALQQCNADSEVREKLIDLGVEPIVSTVESSSDFLVAERKKWSEVVRAAEVTVE